MADKRIQQYPLKATIASNDLILIADSSDVDANGYLKYKKVESQTLATSLNRATVLTRAELVSNVNLSSLIQGGIYVISNAVSGTLELMVFATDVNVISELAINVPNGEIYTYNYANDTATNGFTTSLLDFTPQTAPAYLRGRVWYDSDTESLSYYDDISGTSNQIGKEEHVRVRNTTGVTITNGSVVYVSGATGQTPQITLAQANADGTSNVIGIVTHNISHNAFGKVTTFGIVNDVNTLAFAEGSILYLSQSVAGGLTSTRPSAPNFAVIVGICLHSHATQGKILVNTNKQGLGFGTANQLLGINAGATGQEYKTLNGTTSQVVVTNASGSITLSLPQSIATTSTPQFAGLGLGVAASTSYVLRASSNLTGNTVTRGIVVDGTIQSDSTTGAIGFLSSLSTQATSFTSSALSSFYSAQGTIGVGSTVTTWNGFHVDTSFTKATNNYGFRGQIASGANRWNIFMDGTAQNHLQGDLLIGTTTNTNSRKLLVNGNAEVTDIISNKAAGNSRGLQIQTSGVDRWYIRANTSAESGSNAGSDFAITRYNDAGVLVDSPLSINRATGAVTLGTALGVASGGTGITTTPSNGFVPIGNGTNYVSAALTGTANQVVVTNGAGSITLSLPQSINTTATPLFGRLALGGNSLISNRRITIEGTITGSTTAYGMDIFSTIQSDVTSTAFGYRSNLGTQATAFTLSELIHFNVSSQGVGAGSSVTNQIGYRVQNNMIGATNTYGFQGLLASAANTWNLYMSGTAANHIQGDVLIGTTSNPSSRKLLVSGTAEITGPVTLGTALGVASGGLGITTTPSNGFVPIGNGTNYVSAGITGTANQVTVTNGAGSITLSLPQSIATTSTPQFAKIGIGGSPTASQILRIEANISGSTTTNSVFLNGVIQNDVTSSAYMFRSSPSTLASAFTLADLSHFIVVQGTIGATSAITEQNGYRIFTNFTGGATNYGFRGQIPSGAGRWNLYMDGTASNHIQGTTLFGTTTDNGVDKVQINGSLSSSMGTTLYTAVNTGQFANITAGGLSAANLAIGIGGTSIGAILQGRTSTASSRLHLNPYGGNVLIGKGGIADSGQLVQIEGTLSVTGAVTLGTALGVSSGGTGLSTAPTNGQLLIGNGTNYTLATLTGTANQVTVTNGAGTITLSLPQSIATTSTVRFGTVGIGIAAATALHAHATSLVTTAVSANYSGRFSNNSTAQIIQLGQGTAGENVIQGGRTSDNTAQPLFIQYYGSRTIVGGSTDNGTSTFQVNGTTNITGNTTIGGTLAVTGALSLGTGNAVTASVATPSTHKVQIVINGTTYYLLASNV